MSWKKEKDQKYQPKIMSDSIPDPLHPDPVFNQSLPVFKTWLMHEVIPFLLIVRNAEVDTLRVTHSPVSGR